MTSPAPDPAQTLYLIDGHAQMFRAFYAIRNPMTSPVTGEPTNATFAFSGMLIKLLEQFNPKFVAMPIDSPGKNFRHELYPDYKANRSPPPEEFIAQIPRMIEIAKLFGIPVLAESSVEADDLIATLTRRVLDDTAHSDVQVRIVTKDKDLQQLLNDRVVMIDIHKDQIIDPQTLLQDKGIRPDQVIEFLMLTGDTADNIPGVDKVGEKTAVKLLGEYDTIGNLYTHLDEIKGKRKEYLAAAIDHFPLTRELITLKDDVEIDFDMENARVGDIDTTALLKLFAKLGFNKHQTDLKRLVGATEKKKRSPATPPPLGGLFANLDEPENKDTPTTPPSPLNGQYDCITTHAQLDEVIEKIKHGELLAVDTETIGLGHRTQICGICLAWTETKAVYIPMRSPDPRKHLSPNVVLDALRSVLEDASIPKCGHNIKYDLLVLREAGVTLKGIVFDSMIGAFLTGAPGISMDALAMSQLGHTLIPITDLIGPRPTRKIDPPQKTMDQIPLEQITPYAAEDADITLRLTNLIKPRLGEMDMADLAKNVEMPLVEVLATMESNGITVNPDVLDEQRQTLQTRIDKLKEKIHDAAGEPINPDSPKQLRVLFFEKLKLPVIKRTKTGPSTDVEVLEKLVDMDDIPSDDLRVPKLLLEYRTLAKLVGTYLGNLKAAIHPDTGRIHASFHQAGTATGRLSSSNPNLQNIPIRTEVGRNIRRAFITPPGHLLVSGDYSQIELRILGHLAEDEALIEAFNQGVDIHTAVAAQVFDVEPDKVTPEQRTSAKTINFGIIYGVTPYGLARRIDNLNVQQAKQLIDDYKKRFSGIDRFLQSCVQQATEYGYVTTILSRRRLIPEIHSTNGQTRSLGERLAINTVVQGSAADLIKLAMVNLHTRIENELLPMKMLLQIHDELVFEVPESDADRCAKIVKHEMESAMSLKVPLTVEMGRGRDWFEAK